MKGHPGETACGAATGYEQYPLRVVLLRNLMDVGVYALGAAIVSGFGPWAAAGYLVYCGAAMVWILRFRCAYCYYYGKRCHAGGGLACARVFRKRDEAQFAARMKYAAAIFPAWTVPVVSGVTLLVLDFRWPLLVLVVVFIPYTFILNVAVMRRLGCARRKQSHDCPVYKG